MGRGRRSGGMVKGMNENNKRREDRKEGNIIIFYIFLSNRLIFKCICFFERVGSDSVIHVVLFFKVFLNLNLKLFRLLKLIGRINNKNN